MERRQLSKRSIRKLSGWFKKINGQDILSTKTHKINMGTSIYQDDIKLLAAEGSGTICLKLEQNKPFNIDLIASNALLRLSIAQECVKLYCIYRGRFILLKEQHFADIRLNPDSTSLYWVSFKGISRTIIFGRNQPSMLNQSFTFTLPPSNKTPRQYWMNKISHYRIDTPAVIYSTHKIVEENAPHHRINLLGIKH